MQKRTNTDIRATTHERALALTSPWAHLLHFPYFQVWAPPFGHAPLSDSQASEALDLKVLTCRKGSHWEWVANGKGRQCEWVANGKGSHWE